MLEDDGRFTSTIATNTKQAFKEILQNEYALAVIDSDIDIPLPEVVKGLRRESPSIKIIIISSEASTPSDYPEIKPDACLGKPFYIPDFTQLLEDILLTEMGDYKKKESSASQSEDLYTAEIPVWLKDVDRTAQHLTRLSLETAAQAALIIRGKKMWAYAGQLSQPAADELVSKIAHYWKHDEESDLSRFISLEETGSEYIIYATSLGAKFVLALAFEAEVPFSKIRTQASELAKGLANIPAEEPQADEDTGMQAWNLPLGDPDDGTSSDAFAALLADLNMPAADATEPMILRREDTKQSPVEVLSPPETLSPQKDSSTVVEASVGVAIPTQEQLPHPQELATSPAPDELDLAMADLESPIPALKNLTYVCVLIPRLPHHHLVSDLAKYLDAWMKELSVAFGWRLEHLAVRPNYLQWVAAVQPSLAPEDMLKKMRRYISQRVFEQFPKLANENPSGLFWAPGYLMVNGRKPLPRALIQGFIEKTRQYQGPVNK